MPAHIAQSLRSPFGEGIRNPASHLARAAAGLLLVGCTGDPVSTDTTPLTSATCTIRAMVPDGTPTVYVAGNTPALGDWDPSRVAMVGTGSERSLAFDAPVGSSIEFKLTLGSWATEALDVSGHVGPNHRMTATPGATMVLAVSQFRVDTGQADRGDHAALSDPAAGGVLGTLVTWKDVTSKHLARSRTVQVWLPPAYDHAQRYPVLYMHDGQNLFDPRLAAFGTDWGIDEAIVAGVANGSMPPLIVVAVWNTPDRRREYNPWDEMGEAYARFLIDELMPRVNADFSTQTGPAHTGTMGSSMGGLISFYLCQKHADVFGLGGCVSTHFPYNAANLAQAQARGPERAGAGDSGRADSPQPARDARPLILRDIADGATFPRGPRLWFDFGTVGLDAAYEPVQKQVDAWLESQGLVRGRDFESRKYDGADHSERAWRQRAGEALAFLFGNGG